MTVLLGPIETLVNATLNADPISVAKLRKLDGSVIKMMLPNWYITCYIVIHPKGVQLLEAYQGDVDVTISGEPLDLWALMNRARQGKALTNKTVAITGDMECAQQFTQVLAGIDIDWEEKLARVVGDIPAHFVGKTVTRLTKWRRDLHDTFRQNITEYAQEECHALPSKEAVNDFCSDIDGLRHDVERLSARITRLQKYL